MSRDQMASADTCFVTSLPQELIDKVLDEIGPDLDALKSCSLVCHTWLSRSTQNLFAQARVCVRAVEGVADADVMYALLGPGRIHDYVTTLSMYQVLFEQWAVVKTLPRLRKLYVCSYSDMFEQNTEAPLVVPEPFALGRSIDILVVYLMPLHLLDWILRMFDTIDTLDIHTIKDVAVPTKPAHHIVRSCHTKYIGRTVFNYIADALDTDGLESVTIDVDGYGVLADAFVKKVERSIKAYHHIDRTINFRALRSPVLSACQNLTSVSLSTHAFNPNRPDFFDRTVAFLGALPPNVEHIGLVYTTYWTTAGELAQKVLQCAWDKLGFALLKYTRLIRLAIGAERDRPWYDGYPEYPKFLDDPSLGESILGRLPEELRDRVVFV
ncbi:hypothetical protein PsYK624_115250 [Phanerochaete sordida]|uniref:F-box domain-containing protein n=1 Tax=Phanerochaete sordida TaxID=48140 RepID=A0A9P3GIE3_9APHY|nr:hypothetical protein PsYK624_115250 [Phanerochaete sordida]